MTSPNFSCINALFFFCDNQIYVWQKDDYEKSCPWSTLLYFIFAQDIRKKPKGSHEFSQRSPLEVLKSVADQPRVVQYSQIDSIGVSGDKKGLHWYQWYDWYQ